jgi:hypothetical protein
MSKRGSDGIGMGLVAGVAIAVFLTQGGISSFASSTPTTTPVSATPLVPTDPKCFRAHFDYEKDLTHTCWDGLINQYDWNKEQAFKIMWCESRGFPAAKNPNSTATGLFQILGGSEDPKANVQHAYEMYKTRGWQPWACKP